MLGLIAFLLVTSSITFSSCADEASALAYLEEQAALGVSSHELLERAHKDLSIAEKITYMKTAEGGKRRLMAGTVWCGRGNSSNGDYNALGIFKDVDTCCRAHDHCPFQIHKGNQRWGLVNPKIYTVSDCRCDNQFKKCLKDAHDPIGWSVGSLFFNLLGIPCFDVDKDADMEEKEISAKKKYTKPQKAHLRELPLYKKKKAKEAKKLKSKFIKKQKAKPQEE